MKQTVVIHSGSSWEKWNFKSIDQGGIGGSESWQILLAREFDKLGYRVINFNDCEQDCIDGKINYFHYSKFEEFIEYNYIDYFISSRSTDVFKLNIRAKNSYVQIHDVWMLSDRNQLFLDKVTKFCCLSEWHREFVADYHKISPDKIAITSNGIDLNRFLNQDIERIPFRLIYSSSLDRGLDNLLYVFDFIKKELPKLELHIFYGLNTWEKSAEIRPDEKEKIKKMKEAMNKDGIFYHGRVGQNRLAEEMLKSSLWIYPTSFEETFCITSIEAQAAGLPVICSNYAGLRTTVNDTGILIGDGSKYYSYSLAGRTEFFNKVIQILKDKEIWTFWSKKSIENANKYSWDKVALGWVDLFKASQ